LHKLKWEAQFYPFSPLIDIQKTNKSHVSRETSSIAITVPSNTFRGGAEQQAFSSSSRARHNRRYFRKKALRLLPLRELENKQRKKRPQPAVFQNL